LLSSGTHVGHNRTVATDRFSDTHSEPGQKPEMINSAQRQAEASRLDGYLDALASVDGRFREFVMSAVLLKLGERGAEEVVAEHLAGSEHHNFEIVRLTRGERWTEVEQFLRENLLTRPLGTMGIDQLQGLEETRNELAFQATDMVMFLSPNHSPQGILHLVLSEREAISSVGCAIEFEEDVLLIQRTHWRSAAQAGVTVA